MKEIKMLKLCKYNKNKIYVRFPFSEKGIKVKDSSRWNKFSLPLKVAARNYVCSFTVKENSGEKIFVRVISYLN